ncbi:MAG: zinc ribbon domain-containing protein [Microcoleaceae cyanobacterium]
MSNTFLRSAIEVNPNGTSQECSNCGHKVKKRMRPSRHPRAAGMRTKQSLSQRIHNCPVCHVTLCRDLNAAINIKKRAEGHPVLAQSMSSMKSHARSPRCNF